MYWAQFPEELSIRFRNEEIRHRDKETEIPREMIRQLLNRDMSD